MSPLWLLRMKRWAQNPPGTRRVALVLGVGLVCGLIVLSERAGWWPDWATTEPTGPRRTAPALPRVEP